jgi:Ca-activated chloride channel family protein
MPMSELHHLKESLRRDPVAPRQEAREAAIRAGMEAFDAHRAGQRQGFPFWTRLRSAAFAALGNGRGKRPMRYAHALAGGASLAVLTLAVLTTASLQTSAPRMPREEQAVVPTSEMALDSAAPPGLRQEEGSQGKPASVAPNASRIAEADALTRQAEPLQDRAAIGALSAPMDAVAPVAPPSTTAPPLPAAAPAMSVQQSTAMPAEQRADAGYHDVGRDRFTTIETNPLKVTADEPVSTFSIDVDTSSYSFMRASLSQSVLPQVDAVRVEELVNYFPYDYPLPESREQPFRASVTVLPTPWNAATRLVHIGIKGYEIAAAERPKANLVFLLDTSGSMDEPNKLPLLVNSMKLLVDGLKPDDTVSIVTYAGGAGTLLEPTRASDKVRILAALENLWAGGSTAGAEGIRQAYQLAQRNFDPAGVNRVILATDGDFNVGITDPDELKSFVERQRTGGIYLSVLGFGMGNYNDEMMQTLAQNGNGAAAYIDTLNEARKVLVEEAGSTVFPIAEDVKIQVEFNPSEVSEYRLVGYETRLLQREDFNNDKVDAGEIGSGHTVTALYEITPAGSGADRVDPLRYGSQQPQVSRPAAPEDARAMGEYGFLKIRYKLPGSDTSQLIETPISRAAETSVAAMPVAEARFAAAVAAFGQLLRGGEHTGSFGYDDVIALAQANKGPDEFGYRTEFVNLVRLAKSAQAMAPLRQ